MKRFSIDGAEYDESALSAEGKVLVKHLKFTYLQVQVLSNQQVLLRKAKNAYISDLKSEIVQGRTGIDLSTLFSDD